MNHCQFNQNQSVSFTPEGALASKGSSEFKEMDNTQSYSSTPEHDQTDYANQFKVGDIVHIHRTGGHKENCIIGIVKKVYEKGNLFVHALHISHIHSSHRQCWNRYGVLNKENPMGYYTRNDDIVVKYRECSVRKWVTETHTHDITEVTLKTNGETNYREFTKSAPREIYSLYVDYQGGNDKFAVMHWTDGSHESWSELHPIGNKGVTKNLIHKLKAEVTINYLRMF